MTDLDKHHLFRETDPQDMLARISELPQQCRDAWANAQSLQLPAKYRQAEAVVILGMGGSAIGGDLLRTLLRSECPVPFIVNRKLPDLPEAPALRNFDAFHYAAVAAALA